MALTSGSKLGPYEILYAIGVGGMGEVYRARDTKLNRAVALKVLPAAMANDAERMARFHREAQVLASLNHPNIASIYGFEESGPTRALVMELVEGPTLAERISVRAPGLRPWGETGTGDRRSGTGAQKAPLQLDEVLHIAKQIAEALEYAHERGIIHRDLKPANIKVTPEGAVKVLDFGLAKALDANASQSDSQDSPTVALTSDMTHEGMILGTAAYMPPEQAKGKPANRRADIWAFGCVLYEMLCGKKPFEGATASETLAAVIKDEPDWTNLPGSTPPRVRELSHRCLMKDPKQRLQAIGDARITIEETLSGEAGDALAPEVESRRAAPAGSRTLRRGIIAVAAAAALALAVAAGHFLWRLPAQPSWTGVMLGGPTIAISPRLSPDGRLLAFAAVDPNGVLQLWVMQPDSGNRVMLTHSREKGFVIHYSWSPDGSRIYYDRWDDQPKGIFAVSALGGDEQLILEDAMTPEALPDGSLLIIRLNSENHFQVFHYWPETGQTKPLSVEVLLGLPFDYIRAVPGGHDALVIGTKVGQGADAVAHLYDVDLASESMRQLPEEIPGEFGAHNVTVAASADGKYAITSTLNGDSYQVSAIPLDGHGPTRTLFNMTHFISSLDMGADGSIYLDQNDRASDLVRFSAEGGHVETITSLANSEEYYEDFTVLPDGRAVRAERTASHSRLILVEAGKDPVPLVNSTDETGGPMSPVGSDQVAFMIGPHPRHEIALAALSNGRIIRRLSFDEGEVDEMGISPDRQTLFCLAGGVIWSVPLSGGAPHKVRTGDGFAVDAATQSLVIEVREPQKARLIRVPLSGGPEQEIPGPFHLGYFIDAGSIRNGKLVAPLGGATWYWPPGIFDLASGKSARIPLDYTSDFHHMAWTPDGKIMAVADGWNAAIWKFTPQVK
ncbi:MAG TPA: protein kinase [Terriglobia bacterium]|nr:protein kinase [Terriglobia bacterium]